MNFVHKNYRNIIESDENALLDISDFDDFEDNSSYQLIQFMGKSGKRKQSLNSEGDQSLSANDDDSGFCGSNLSVSAQKMVRFDDEMLLLKALMKEVNEPVVNDIHINNKIKAQNTVYSSKSKNGKYELKILSQPEEQHRARYMTEGSRGAIKDKSGLGHPVVKLCGFNKSPVRIQCFIGHDKQLGSSHLFYQASKITGKNSTRCNAKKVDGTNIIFMEACPQNDMQVTVDCVGILKERNVDVEQKLARLKAKSENDDMTTVPTKKRSTRCRLVFRAQMPDTNEILQVVSSPILCTQPLGLPEISKKSLHECDVNGGIELFIIGKNFLKDTKVIWKTDDWTKIAEPDKEFLHPTHMICVIPCYDGPKLKTNDSIDVSLFVKSGGKYSEPQKFTFNNVERVNKMALINGTAQITCASNQSQLFVSKIEEPIILTVIGPTHTAITAPAHSLDSQMVNPNQFQINVNQIPNHVLNGKTLCFTRNNSSPERILPIFDEDTNMSSSMLLNQNSTTSQNTSQINQSFNLTNDLIFNKTVQNIENNLMDNSIDTKQIPLVASSGHSLDVNLQTIQPVTETMAQYLPLNSLNEIQTNGVSVDNCSQIRDMSAINPMNCDPILQSMPSNQMSSFPTEQSLTISDTMCSVTAPIDVKSTVNMETDAMITQNPVLTSTANSTPTAQANNISALSEMSDAELLCFINPATFDQI